MLIPQIDSCDLSMNFYRTAVIVLRLRLRGLGEGHRDMIKAKAAYHQACYRYCMWQKGQDKSIMVNGEFYKIHKIGLSDVTLLRHTNKFAKHEGPIVVKYSEFID